jgi:hypothetical protein
MKKIFIPSIIVSSIVGIFLIGLSFFNIYLNNKTDGFGSGGIEITHCKEDNWAWKIYLCTGDYNSSTGMIERPNVTVRVTGGELKPGEHVGDVYPGDGLPNSESKYYITGLERASVYHNVLWIVLAAIGFFAPLACIAYLIGKSSKLNKTRD